MINIRYILLSISTGFLLQLTAQEEDWSKFQLDLINASCLHEKGFTGKGVTIAHFDDGCDGCDEIDIFQYSREKGYWKGNYDFIQDTVLGFKGLGSHGTATVSIVHGKIDGKYTGVAYDANILVGRTEDVKSETHDEERYWRRAVDWAIENGADIITSSLQYNEFDEGEGDYTYEDMDGKTTIIANAADYAASKGIIVVTLQGNFGATKWRYLSTPGDADSVITVGASRADGIKAAFSGFGPSYDGRIKPDVMAMGQSTAVATSNNKIVRGNGTSYAAPAIAGLLACLKQAHPERSNMEMIAALRLSSDRYRNPDAETGYGYGIPDGCLAHDILNKMDNAHESIGSWVMGDMVRYKQKKNSISLKTLERDNQISKVVIKNTLEKEVKMMATLKNIDVSILRQGSYLADIYFEDEQIETIFIFIE